MDNRRQFRIAVVDDEAFSPQESLARHNYDITYLRDIPSIERLKPFPIVLCDLIGVGTALSSTQQGAHVIVEAKKNYPEKIIVAYTGGGREELLQASIRAADYFIKKDASTEEWMEILDKAIEDLANPARVWRKLRHRLLDGGITPYQLAELEDSFVSKTLSGEAFSLEVLNYETKRLRISPAVKDVLEYVVIHVGFELARHYIGAAKG